MSDSRPTGTGREPVEIDTSIAHASRVYDYLLGGTDNFTVDRTAAEHMATALGGLDNARADARANRRFLVRVVRHLVDAGVRQFLDIGTGVPNADNTLATAQQAAPDARVVCVDNDPVVLAHAHTLLESTPEGAAAFLDADLRDPDDILDQAAVTLDLTQPVALVLVSIVHVLGPGDEPYDIVSRLLDPLPSGSYLAMSHLATDIQPEETRAAVSRMNEMAQETYVLRDTAEFGRFFGGLDMVEPGIVRVDEWHPDGGEPPFTSPTRVPAFHAALARKP